MACTKLYTKRELSKRMQNYTERNQKRNSLHVHEYMFLKHLYMYLTKQQTSTEFKDELYLLYIKIVNLSFFPNRKEPSPRLQDAFYKHMQIILETEYGSPWTFILLNTDGHYQKMLQSVEFLHTWAMNPQYYGYASENEFWDTMEFMRKQFTENKVDMYNATGKWPKQIRNRFQRE